MVDPVTILACLTLATDPALINAIISVESNWNPAAINVNRWEGENFQTDDIRKNAAAVSMFIDHGYTVDVGLMLINSHYLKRFGVPPLDAFDVCTNVQLGEQILTDAINVATRQGRQGDDALRGALSIYNTGNLTNGFANGYVEKVWQQYRNPQTHALTEQTARLSDTAIELSSDQRSGAGADTEDQIESVVTGWVAGHSDKEALFDYAVGDQDLVVDWRRHE